MTPVVHSLVKLFLPLSFVWDAAALADGDFDIPTTKSCVPLCKCDFAKAKTFMDKRDDEVCLLQNISGCLFGDGRPAASNAKGLAECWRISGRGRFLQKQLVEPDVLRRCAPPKVSCAKPLQPALSRVLQSFEQEIPLGSSDGFFVFGQTLQRLGFNRSSVLLIGQHEADAALYPRLADQGLPAIHSDLAEMIRLFVVGSPIYRNSFERLVPESARRALMDNNAVGILGELVLPYVQIFPVENGLFITDLPGTDGVMYIGVDSNGLAASAKNAHAGLAKSRPVRILDMCTGSGVQGIIASLSAAASGFDFDLTLLDINPRAGRFARANLLLNGVQGRFTVSDIYKEVQGQQFDLILANTPFVPSSTISEGAWTYFTDGGPDGERITSRIVTEGLPLLTGNGRILIATPIYNEAKIFTRLATWGMGEGYGALVIHSDPEPWEEKDHPTIRTVAREGIIAISRLNKAQFAFQVLRAWTALTGCGKGPKWNNWMNCFLQESALLQTQLLDMISHFLDGSWSRSEAGRFPQFLGERSLGHLKKIEL